VQGSSESVGGGSFKLCCSKKLHEFAANSDIITATETMPQRVD